MWIAFVNNLKEQDKLPVVIFTLATNRYDGDVDASKSVDLITQTEKSHVRSCFKKCIKRLNKSDKELHQVNL